MQEQRIYMQNNRLCRLLGIRYPIIQAGMVWVSDWNLALAASNAGILGTLGSGSMSLDELSMNIEKMQTHTQNPFAVNIPMLRPDAKDIASLCLEKGVRIFITSAGNPEKIVPLIKKEGIILIHVVPSVKGALKSANAGVDAVICEGFEAGGHNSPDEVTTLALTPQVADAVDIPVVAAGGIADGRGIAAVMALGADGAQLGTRFIATTECNAHLAHKELIVKALDTGTCILGRNIGMLRVIRNSFAQEMEKAEKQGAGDEELRKIIGNEYNRNKEASVNGNLDEGTFQAGQSSGMVKDIISVKALVMRLVREYEDARQRLKPM